MRATPMPTRRMVGALGAMALVVACAGGARPADAAENRYGVAVIIGNKTYADRIPRVDFAHNDADAMKRFVIEALGYRPGNIIDLRDATRAQIGAVFGSRETHKGRLFNWVRAGKSDVIVFYSGHGVPGLRDRRGYLLPVDGDPDLPQITGYPVDLLYDNLAKIDARSITVYLDACFSGDSPKGMLIRSASGITVTPRLARRSPKLTVLTAAQGDQLASWDEAAKHGLFTLHLLKALGGAADRKDVFGNGDGKITVEEVKRYLDEEMTYAARRSYGREQRATVRGNPAAVLATFTPGAADFGGDAAVEEMDLEMVTVGNANVRSGPSTRNERMATIPRGSRVLVTGRTGEWYRIALAGGRAGFVWGRLLGEGSTSGGGAGPAPWGSGKGVDPSKVMLDSGLTLTDWALLAEDRLAARDYRKLIVEANVIMRRYGAVPVIESVMHRAVLGDVERARPGVGRIERIAAYRRSYGSFPDLDDELDRSVARVLDKFAVEDAKAARAALKTLARLRQVAGDATEIARHEARAYHVLERFDDAEAAYRKWLQSAAKDHPDRKQMALGLFKARRGEKMTALVRGGPFRDCPHCPEMVVIRPGRFMMGASEGGAGLGGNEVPRHGVTIGRPFAIGKYEVTFAEWDACVADGGCGDHRPDDYGWGRGKRPVVNVSWQDAKGYVAYLSRRSGKPYRLPSEAEWEFAARAGSTAYFWWGENFVERLANCGECGSRWDNDRTAPVGSFKANPFGLHDTAGNVWEWVEDCWHDTYDGAPADGGAWASGDNCEFRVIRGGSWDSKTSLVRTAYRDWVGAADRSIGMGFRVVRDLP